MYNMTKDINSEGSSINFMDVGIHDDVKLIGVEYKENDNGNKFMVFHFVGPNGETLNHTEWEPKDADPEKLKNKVANQMIRVKHILTKFISEDLCVFKVENFKQFAENTIHILGKAYEGKLVRVKVVYSNNNYTSLPNYVPFMEEMSVPRDKTKLRISSIDKMVRDKADTEPVVVTNPFDSPSEPNQNQEKSVVESASNSDVNKLPF